MLGIGGTELVIILLFGFLIFGPEKLPQMGRTVGRAIRQFREASETMNKKFKDEVYDPFQEAVDPYKNQVEGGFKPMKDDLAAIKKDFDETKDIFKDPFGLNDVKDTFNNTLTGAAAKSDAGLPGGGGAVKTTLPKERAVVKKDLAASLYGLDETPAESAASDTAPASDDSGSSLGSDPFAELDDSGNASSPKDGE